MEPKKKYLLVERYTEGAFPIVWNKIPDKVFEEIHPDFQYTILEYMNNSLTLESETVVYFKEVDEFVSEDILEIERNRSEKGTYSTIYLVLPYLR
jgi:hypothetical protein